MKGKLTNGFSYEVNDNIGRDVRLLELLRKITKVENEQRDIDEKSEKAKKLDEQYFELTFDIIEKILGEEQKEKLYDYLERKNGIADIKEVSLALQEIMASLGEKSEEIKN